MKFEICFITFQSNKMQAGRPAQQADVLPGDPVAEGRDYRGPGREVGQQGRESRWLRQQEEVNDPKCYHNSPKSNHNYS